MRELENITIEITSKCNFNCKHCGNNSGKIDKASLKKEEIIDLIDQMNKLSVKRVSITGGEPFCDENIFNYLKYAKEKIPKISISSNGYLINEAIVEKLVALKIDKVVISLDGTEEYHDEFRGMKDAYQRAINAIKLLTKSNIEVKVRSVVTKDNTESILNLMEITNNFKLNRHEILPVCPIGRANKAMALSSDEYREFLINAINRINTFKNINITYQLKPVFHQEYLFENTDKACREKSLSYSCDAFKTSMEICYNGDVIGCSFVRMPVGNIRNFSLEELWKSKKALKIYELISNQNRTGECENCEFNKNCNGGCFANRIYGSEINEKDIYCFVKRREKNVQ